MTSLAITMAFGLLFWVFIRFNIELLRKPAKRTERQEPPFS